MIDKIHKLERIGIITDAQEWQDMRKIKNHISHEYPDHPEIIARYLSKLFELTPNLLEILARIKAQSHTDNKTSFKGLYCYLIQTIITLAFIVITRGRNNWQQD
tara:strand:- start:51 stop:362 length:312 start_codon:yes stop_codon:yes gene_type:complete